MTDPNNNDLSEEEQERIVEVLGEKKAKEYIWEDDE